jgi:oxygen-dependent protoporphyrinogen oxidase
VSGACVAVVGAGAGGLAAAWTLLREAPGLDVVVLEQASRAGGLIATERTPEGFLIEHGADCLITTKPWGVRLVRELGLAGAIVCGVEPRRSWVARDGVLVRLPQMFAPSPRTVVREVLQTPLLTFRGKLRIGGEPFVRKARDGRDESVGAFVTRRFGRELLESVVAPLIGGIYGGDADSLSAEACLPRLRALERQHGSVALGMRRMLRARQRRVTREEVLPPMVSLQDGMETLPATLAARLGPRLSFGVAVERISRRADGRFGLATSAGDLTCDGVVLAVPAWRAPALLETLAPDVAAPLAALPHMALDCVTLAWDDRAIPALPAGTGFVTAPVGSRPTIACTWASRKWPGRAAPGFTLVRSVLSQPDAANTDVETLALRDLRELLGIDAPPALVRVRRHPRATPIYRVGWGEEVAAMRARARALGAFALAGNAHGGVGIPDCVRSGELAAEAVLADLVPAGRDAAGRA